MENGTVVRRCTICAISTPDVPQFAACPQCGESTDRCTTSSGITHTLEECTSILNHRKFEEYLEQEGKQ